MNISRAFSSSASITYRIHLVFDLTNYITPKISLKQRLCNRKGEQCMFKTKINLQYLHSSHQFPVVRPPNLTRHRLLLRHPASRIEFLVVSFYSSYRP